MGLEARVLTVAVDGEDAFEFNVVTLGVVEVLLDQLVHLVSLRQRLDLWRTNGNEVTKT